MNSEKAEKRVSYILCDSHKVTASFVDSIGFLYDQMHILARWLVREKAAGHANFSLLYET
jgi:hypothetical protein